MSQTALNETPMLHKMTDQLLAAEIERQQNTLCLIASENHASANVMAAMGNPFANKYAEGEPGKRYYQGNTVVDDLESYLNDLILKAFRVSGEEWHANAKAVSAGVGNFTILNALLRPGDKIMGMYLYDGGHLSHGWDMDDGRGVTIASRMFDVLRYHVDRASEEIDYDKLAEQAAEYKPNLIITGGTAYPREINHERVAKIAKDVGAYYFADVAHEAGLIVGGVNTNPLPHADVISMSTQKTLRGPRGNIIVCRKDLADKINRSIFPGLQGGPFVHQMFALAVALEEALDPSFAAYTKAVIANAKVLEKTFRDADIPMVAGGTDKHSLVLKVKDEAVTGKDVALAMERAGLVANYNTVPFDTRKPFNPSGVRVGTPAGTTRGLMEAEWAQVGEAIASIFAAPKDDALIAKTGEQIRALCQKFPLWY